MEAIAFRVSGRKLPSWIDGFLTYTDGITSPTIFRRWSAIAAVAAAIERKVYVMSMGHKVYPNLYTFLVGDPGKGKSFPFGIAETLWRNTLKEHFIAPVSVTKASMMDALNAAQKVHHPTGETHGALYVAVGELGALIPEYDRGLMNALTYLYDGARYEETRRGGNLHIQVDNPLINLLAGTTPGFLSSMLPPGAWNEGFMARVILIFSDQEVKKPLNLNEDSTADKNLYAALEHDLVKIGEVSKRMQFTPEARDELERFYLTPHPIEVGPTHPRLQHYNGRRIIHLQKLCMISAIDRGVETIQLHDFHTAIDWLLEAELAMPNIFKAMISGGDAEIMLEAHHFIITQYVRTGNPIPRAHLIQFLAHRVSAMAVDRLYGVMHSSQMFLEQPNGLVPLRPS